MFGQKSSIVVVFVDRNRLQFYGGTSPSVLTLDIPPAVCKDLEIVNRDALYTLVNQWLKQNNLGGARLLFVLSPMTYFDKVMTTSGESEQETEILMFYDSVPFEDLATKVLTIANKKIAFAVNRDYMDAIRHAFTLQGFQIIAVVPAVILGSLATKRWLDAEMGLYILKHIDTLRTQTLIEREDEANQGSPPITPTAQNNPRIMTLVGVFGLLLLVLIAMIFIRR